MEQKETKETKEDSDVRGGLESFCDFSRPDRCSVGGDLVAGLPGSYQFFTVNSRSYQRLTAVGAFHPNLIHRFIFVTFVSFCSKSKSVPSLIKQNLTTETTQH